MHPPAARLLEHWGEFYLLVGTAAAALVALLFVAASVGAGILSRERSGPTRTYMSPVAFHFTSVLFTSAIALVPSHTPMSLGVLIGINALVGAAYGSFVMWRLLTDDISDLADRLSYGAAPLLAYLAGIAAAYAILRGIAHWPELLAGALVLLLIVNIRNAWDLMLSLARRPRTDGPPS